MAKKSTNKKSSKTLPAKDKTQKISPASEKVEPCAWVITADMGFGHQRAAYPLKDIAFERVITANNDQIISNKEMRIWNRTRRTYEFLSRLKSIPFIGKIAFGALDALQNISPFYPFRDLSKPNFTVLQVKRQIKNGLGKSMIAYTSKNNLPVFSTFFIPELAYGYEGKDVYCLVTDSDINRIWVADNPKASSIRYFSPCAHATRRLQEYGVPAERIIETGFPLPKENIGSREQEEILKHDLLARLVNLDPTGTFFSKYGSMVKEKLNLPAKQQFMQEGLAKFKDHPITIMFMIGGSGAQTEIGMQLIDSLKSKLISGEMNVVITVGTRLEAKQYYEQELKKRGLESLIDKSVKLIFALDKKTFFAQTNQALRTTDIIWTKPSEMSFYTALGIPIIIAPPIGSHEEFNKRWLENIGSGFVQEDPRYALEWLTLWIQDGRLADAAMQGFIDAPRHGTYEIEDVLRSASQQKLSEQPSSRPVDHPK